MSWSGSDGMASDFRHRDNLSSAALSQLRTPLAQTLENYAVCPENRLARRAVQSVLQRPGRFYNPLYLFGPAGSGKTHLVQGMLKAVLGRSPRLRAACLSARQFSAFVAPRAGQQPMESQSTSLRRLELFILEDVQDLAQQDHAQLELTFTLNALCARRSQVVFTGRVIPDELRGISPALCSRFASSAMLPLSAPGRKSRNALLKEFVARRQIPLSQEAFHILADGVPGTMRDLHAALTYLCAASESTGQPIDSHLARQYVTLDSRYADHPALCAIAQIVADHLGVTVSQLQSPRRDRPLPFGRQLCMYLARSLTPCSQGEIGRFFGGRDHSTVLYACQRMTELLKNGGETREILERLKAAFHRQQAACAPAD